MSANFSLLLIVTHSLISLFSTTLLIIEIFIFFWLVGWLVRLSLTFTV